MITSFKELVVWQKAHELVLEIYRVTENFPKSEEFGLKSQIRRAIVSIPSNIAEGFKRKSQRDSIHFYNIAEASLEEVKYQTILSRDLGFVNLEVFNKLETLEEEVSKLLCGWIKCQNKK